ncbi:hydrogenase nickel incorporation protein HypB [Geobacter sp. DSM 9736]|uniref:hydrogenase nickel incorporation protein HypB n=1 Tax=Geobacter sp. DSM 9736 TaxID=1277350 RepID=UPI000B511CD9|nr:hydrogenase nickel incorporation protein HypB [Geobacter sp. DSM 9736]SNB47092.1 Hydrogenase nickel incorporation protein HypB [Geobacter sp. DSM 9736]
MCITCGCEEDHNLHDGGAGHHHHDGKQRILVESNLLAKNDRFARSNRERFAAHGIFVLNLVSSPGSGKTTLLERTLSDLRDRVRCAVIEGDQQTDNDAVRIAATGVPVKQVNTGAGCHLDAHMVGHAAADLPLQGLDLLFIENVGNLVCPASFDLGEHHKVVMLSVTEGEDKPVKYPQMFRAAELMIITKSDLAPYVAFDAEACRSMALSVNPRMEILELSASSGEGIDSWYRWLSAGIERAKKGGGGR